MSLTTWRASMICSGVTTGLRSRRRTGARHQIENLPFLGARWINDFQLQHEAIHLRFGQGISSFLFNRILRGEHEERFFQFKSLIADRDLLFLHRFEQRALHFGGRAIDFVGENEVREDRAFARGEPAALRIVNLRADQVGGQKVGRELQPGKFYAETLRERFDGKRFGETRNAFEQNVAVGEQADDESLDQISLADDDFAHLAHERAHESAGALDFFVYCGDSVTHNLSAKYLPRMDKQSRNLFDGDLRDLSSALSGRQHFLRSGLYHQLIVQNKAGLRTADHCARCDD